MARMRKKCRLPIRALSLMAAFWPLLACAADEEPLSLNRAPEIKFEKRASYSETSLQHSVVGMLGYSLAITVTPEGRSELSGGALLRPVRGLEIGLERKWDRSASARNETWTLADPAQFGAEFDQRGGDGRPKPRTLNLGRTGPLNYELNGSRLRVKYHIDSQTVVSLRARYDRTKQQATTWLTLERRF
jgi:hypothetical protein